MYLKEKSVDSISNVNIVVKFYFYLRFGSKSVILRLKSSDQKCKKIIDCFLKVVSFAKIQFVDNVSVWHI